MCFDGIAHSLHPGLMKFHCSLQLRGLMEHTGHLTIEKVVEYVSKRGLQSHGHGYTRADVCSVDHVLPLEKGFKDVDVVLKGVGNDFELSSLSCLLQFQVAVERGDRGLDRFQVERVLRLLDLCDVEQLPRKEGNRIRTSNSPRDPAELILCVLQDKEFLRLGPCVTNHAYSVVAHFQLARGDSEHGLCEYGGGCRGAKVQKSPLLGGKLSLALQNADAPSLWEGGLGFVYHPIVRACVVGQVQPRLGQGAHPETTVNKQAFGDKLTAESQTCLDLVTVERWDLVDRNLAFERALELQQDNGAVKCLEVAVWTAGYFAIKRVALGKVE